MLKCKTNNKKKRKNKVVKCYKRLKKSRKHKFETPFQHSVVPLNGIQTPKTKIAYRKGIASSFTSGVSTYVHDGAIHAYTSINRGVLYNEQRRYVSYAFNVYAYGEAYDLVCRMLYTPACDFTALKKDRVAFCEQYAKSQKPIDKKTYQKLFCEHIRN